MEVWRSLELSWFGTGEAPDEIARWIGDIDAPHSDSEERTDFYFLGAGERLSVKFREERIEVKERTGTDATWKHGPWAATAEHWKKWRFEADESGTPDDPRWCPVRKSATDVRWWYDKNGIEADEGATYRVDLGLQRLVIGERPYWRLAFDIGSKGKPPFDLIARVADRAFKGAPPPPKGCTARSFPEFLGGLVL